MAIRPHPLISPPASSPLPSSLFFTLYRGPRQLPVTAMARRPHGGVDLGEVYYDGHCHYDTYCTLCCCSPPRLSPVPALAHHARPCFCMQVSHITAGGCFCVCRGGLVERRSVAGVDTDGLLLSLHRYPPPSLSTLPSSSHSTRGRWDVLAHTTSPCLHAGV